MLPGLFDDAAGERARGQRPATPADAARGRGRTLPRVHPARRSGAARWCSVSSSSTSSAIPCARRSPRRSISTWAIREVGHRAHRQERRPVAERDRRPDRRALDGDGSASTVRCGCSASCNSWRSSASPGWPGWVRPDIDRRAERTFLALVIGYRGTRGRARHRGFRRVYRARHQPSFTATQFALVHQPRGGAAHLRQCRNRLAGGTAGLDRFFPTVHPAGLSWHVAARESRTVAKKQQKSRDCVTGFNFFATPSL
jgi:hypothetical protein